MVIHESLKVNSLYLRDGIKKITHVLNQIKIWCFITHILRSLLEIFVFKMDHFIMWVPDDKRKKQKTDRKGLRKRKIEIRFLSWKYAIKAVNSRKQAKMTGHRHYLTTGKCITGQIWQNVTMYTRRAKPYNFGLVFIGISK